MLSIFFRRALSTGLQGGSGALRIPRGIKSTNKVVKIALEKVTLGVVYSRGVVRTGGTCRLLAAWKADLGAFG